jgi:spermidine/putrescine transport system substrate-binding protein
MVRIGKKIGSLVCLLVAAGWSIPAAHTEELNALVWCDHTDPALIEPFEKKFNVKVNLKEYEGTGTGLSIVQQSQPGDWDVFVVDGIDVPQVIDKGLLAPLPVDQLPVNDIFPAVRLDKLQTRDGKTYAVTEKFGYNTVSFDSDKVSAADLEDMSVLWNSDKFKGRIAVYDYYKPVIGLVAMGLGKSTALKEEDLPAIRDALFKLKANTKVIGEVTASQTALATGEVDILFGGGEWVTAGLSGEKPNLQWMVPKQGATRWSQSLGVFPPASARTWRCNLLNTFCRLKVKRGWRPHPATGQCLPIKRPKTISLSRSARRFAGTTRTHT